MLFQMITQSGMWLFFFIVWELPYFHEFVVSKWNFDGVFGIGKKSGFQRFNTKEQEMKDFQSDLLSKAKKDVVKTNMAMMVLSNANQNE